MCAKLESLQLKNNAATEKVVDSYLLHLYSRYICNTFQTLLKNVTSTTQHGKHHSEQYRESKQNYRMDPPLLDIHIR